MEYLVEWDLKYALFISVQMKMIFLVSKKQKK